MRKRLIRIISIAAAVLIIMGLASDNALAAGTSVFSISDFFGLNFGEFVVQSIAWLFNLGLMIMSWFLAIAGFILNFSIKLTLNIKSFVDTAPAIYTTWRTIRDIAGIFLIFFLLYDAIQLILGIRRPKWGESIKNVVMVGILINFSFFFAGLGIDVSNVVSMQIYNAIAPTNQLNQSAAAFSTQAIESQLGDGGLSDMFMTALKIPRLYNVSQQVTTSALGSNGTIGGLFNDVIKIILIGAMGIIIEFTAAFSFAAAGLAFIGRFVILLFLLAFSPIWFMSLLSPEVKAYTKKWTDMYKSMLLFMPIYLLLMYLAMNVLTTTPMFSGPSAAVTATAGAPLGSALVDTVLAQSAAAATGGKPWYQEYMLLAVNAAIVIFMLNLPLVAAASIAGKTLGILEKAQAKFGAGKVWGAVGGFAGTRTIGRVAAAADKGLGNTRLGNKLLARDIRESTTGALAKSKMGGSRSYEERITAKKDVAKKDAEIVRGNTLSRTIGETHAGAAPRVGPDGLPITTSSTMAKMSEKERAASIVSRLEKDSDKPQLLEVMKYARGSDFDSIKKNDEITDEDKAKAGKMRKEALMDAVTKGEAPAIKNMVENMDGKDLLKLGDTPAGTPLLAEDEVVEHLKPSQLKTMSDEGISDGLKRSLGHKIDTWAATHGAPHKAFGFVNKNRVDWT